MGARAVDWHAGVTQPVRKRAEVGIWKEGGKLLGGILYISPYIILIPKVGCGKNLQSPFYSYAG